MYKETLESLVAILLRNKFNVHVLKSKCFEEKNKVNILFEAETYNRSTTELVLYRGFVGNYDVCVTHINNELLKDFISLF